MIRVASAVVFLGLALPGQQQLFAIGDVYGRDSILYRIDRWQSNPTPQVVGGLGVRLSGIAVHPHTGRMLGVEFSRYIDPNLGNRSVIYDIDPLTARVRRQAILAISGVSGLAFDNGGRLFGVSRGATTTAWLLNPASGGTKRLSEGRFGDCVDLAFDRAGVFYGAAYPYLVTFDVDNGGQTRIVGRHAVSRLGGFAIDNSGLMVLLSYTSNHASHANLSVLDPGTGLPRKTFALPGSVALGAAGLAFTGSKGVSSYGHGRRNQPWSIRFEGNPQRVVVDGFPKSGGYVAFLLAATAPADLPFAGTDLLVDLGRGFAIQLPTSLSGQFVYSDQAQLQRLQDLWFQVLGVQSGVVVSSNGLHVNL